MVSSILSNYMVLDILSNYIVLNILSNHMVSSYGYTVEPVLMVRLFANEPGDRDSIPGRVISKIQKGYLIPPCLTFSIIM